MKTTIKLTFLTIFLLLAACTPESRLKKLLKHHPELQTPDTILVQDTLYIPGIKADTQFQLTQLHDTVWLDAGRLSVSMIAKNETLYVQGKCKPDTIFTIHKIPVEKIRLVKPNTLDALIPRIPWIVLGLITILAGLILLFRKR